MDRVHLQANVDFILIQASAQRHHDSGVLVLFVLVFLQAVRCLRLPPKRTVLAAQH